jgi:hypothetical protein
MAKNQVKAEEKVEEKKETKKVGLMDAVIEQSINEFTRPLIQKIKPETLSLLKKIGADKFLPVLSIGLQTFFKEKFGGKTGDVVAEVSAELRRAIVENTDGGGEISSKTSTSSASGIEKTVFSVIFNPEISDKTVELLNAWIGLFKNDLGEERPEKEKKQIYSLVEKMSLQETLVFLTQTEQNRKAIINSFIKTTVEKSFETAIKEFKEDVKKLVANVKTIHAEILVPIGKKIEPYIEKAVERFKEVDTAFAEGGIVGREIVSLRERSEQFRNRRRRQ